MRNNLLPVRLRGLKYAQKLKIYVIGMIWNSNEAGNRTAAGLSLLWLTWDPRGQIRAIIGVTQQLPAQQFSPPVSSIWCGRRTRPRALLCVGAEVFASSLRTVTLQCGRNRRGFQGQNLVLASCRAVQHFQQWFWVTVQHPYLCDKKQEVTAASSCLKQQQQQHRRRRWRNTGSGCEPSCWSWD